MSVNDWSHEKLRIEIVMLERENAALRDRLASELAEVMLVLRDICMSHSDDCKCHGCLMAFRVENKLED
jgi:hypothetical protein